MGLFDSDKEVYVNSSVYNLAGDEDSRPDVMKAEIIRHVVSGSDKPLSKSLLDTMLNGQGMKQRRFFHWAKTNYVYGMPTGRIGPNFELNQTDLYNAFTSVVPLDPGEDLEILNGTVDKAQAKYWVEAWVQKNKPEYADKPKGVSVESNFDPNKTNYLLRDQSPVNIVINFRKEDTLFLEDEEFLIPMPADLNWGLKDPDRRILYMLYNTLTTDPNTKVVSVDGPFLFTYRMGSGVTEFDSLAPTTSDVAEFFPPIPLRIWNKSARDFEAEKWEGIQKAYKKLAGSNVNSLLDQVEENEDIGKIDYCFLVQGVSLNTSSETGKKYLFEFFRRMRNTQAAQQGDYDQYDAAITEAVKDTVLKENWKSVNKIQNYHNPNFGYGSQPMNWSTYNLFPSPNAKQISIFMPELKDFNYQMTWGIIRETDHVGNIKQYDGDQTRTKAKVGEFWFVQGSPGRDRVKIQRRIAGTEGETKSAWVTREVPRTFLMHQYAKRRYTKIEIWDLKHLNYVYKSYSVITEANPALAAEDDSRFIVPLHYPTLTDLGLSNAAKLASTSSYLVFNTVEIVKVKWYQKSFFKFILIVAAIAITALTGPAGAGLFAGSGILGANAAVGAALGASAAMAAVVGAAVNYIAAAIVTAVIQHAAEEYIGGAAGAIIGTIASFVAIQLGSQFAATGNFNVDWGSLMRVDNIIKLTDSVSGAYAQWMQGETEGIVQEIQSASEEYEEQTEEIQKLSEEILGMTDSTFDSIMFTDAAEYFGESREAFLNRTLLTGSDIATLTFAMIENFVPASLELPKAISK